MLIGNRQIFKSKLRCVKQFFDTNFQCYIEYQINNPLEGT